MRSPICALVLLAGCASQSGVASDQDLAERIRAIADEWVGTPYQRGGSSQRGTDCSGFTRAVFAEQFGIELPRTSRDQAKVGEPVARKELEPGDLVFFDLRKGRYRIDHVGLYAGDDRFIHARPKRGVGFDRMDTRVFRRGYRGARRVLAR